ncbi:MAG: sulfotransferase domain-containing protein [Alphaproteobacteria bacterium]|nr:sulfotransferase domain-containing protein [Alphaproteobacteria bacterium]
MRKPTAIPDFFIIGAPKCGTTALYEYLNDRPDIFMPAVKEPNFFATDLNVRRQIPDESTYFNLFRAARAGQLCGEGSVWHLFSTVACRNILAENPHAKFIALIRNPIDMAQSWHAQLVYSLWEKEDDFQTSWRLQDTPRKFPSYVDEPRLFRYRDVCALGSQIERFFETIPAEQRLVLVFDDLQHDTQKIYEQVINFLGIPQDGRTHFPRINERKSHAAQGIARLIRHLSNIFTPIKRALRRAYPHLPSSILKSLYDWQSRFETRPTLAPHFHDELKAAFSPEVRKLEKLLARDFSHWA